MQKLTPEIEIYYENPRSVKNKFRALLAFYYRHNRPIEQAIEGIVTKFEICDAYAYSANKAKYCRIS